MIENHCFIFTNLIEALLVDSFLFLSVWPLNIKSYFQITDPRNFRLLLAIISWELIVFLRLPYFSNNLIVVYMIFLSRTISLFSDQNLLAYADFFLRSLDSFRFRCLSRMAFITVKKSCSSATKTLQSNCSALPFATINPFRCNSIFCRVPYWLLVRFSLSFVQSMNKVGSSVNKTLFFLTKKGWGSVKGESE